MGEIAVRRKYWGAAVILGVALAIMVPAFILPMMTQDSYWINWVWADQFTAELSKGNLYPRWLPKSHGGLGSPVFYYYPPLSFYISGFFGLSGFSTYGSIIAAMFATLAASGFAMFVWLKESGAARPVFGAVIFMAGPYHMVDLYMRGAMAEFTAIALIPCVALGLRRAVNGRTVALALSYSALIMAHLPLALLASLFFIGPYAVYLCRTKPQLLLRVASSLAIGITIAAIYLVPAALLDPFRDTAALYRQPITAPNAWSIIHWQQPGPLPGLKLTFVIIGLLYLQPIVVLFCSDQRRWAIYGFSCLAIAVGLFPPIWELPLLKTVQFPFRLLPMVDFAIGTGLASVNLPRKVVYSATVPIIAGFLISVDYIDKIILIRPKDLPTYPDVPENLPPGNASYSWPSWWALGLAKQHQQRIEIEGRTIDNVFYFPAWEVRCGGRAVRTASDPETKLLSYRGVSCDRKLMMTFPEKLGLVISAAALLLLLMIGALGRLGRPRAKGATEVVSARS